MIVYFDWFCIVNEIKQPLFDQLDKFIVGQLEAKKAVAIALRNRWRRHQLRGEMRNEVIPKNILMIGPTGCGKVRVYLAQFYYAMTLLIF